MKKNEALMLMIHFFETLPDSMPIEKKMELLLNYQELHLKMLPPALHLTGDVAYNCEWETEDEVIDGFDILNPRD